MNFDYLAENDLANLVAVGVPEGVAIEYKRELYGSSDADVKEFLKDCSSFANTAGGHLIVGMEETGGVASAIVPIRSDDPDQELQRLESLCRDGIEPRIAGLRMKAVAVQNGGFVIAIRIPRSWNPPHRVNARNTNRFYGRNSAGVHELSLDELRALFTRSASLTERMRAIRDERLALIDAGRGIVPLAPDPSRLVLHLVPLGAALDQTSVSIERAQALHMELHPIGQPSHAPQINFDGFATVRGGDSCYGYTQIFRNGIIEAVYAGLVSERDGRRLIPSLDFDRRILEVLPKYMGALQSLEISPPIVLMLTLQGVEGAILGVQNDWDDPPQPIMRPVLGLPEIVIDDYGDEFDYQRLIRPAFDALWNAAGFIRSRYFDGNSRWVGLKRR